MTESTEEMYKNYTSETTTIQAKEKKKNAIRLAFIRMKEAQKVCTTND